MKARFIQPQVNTVGLVGHWKFWDGTAFDYSLRGHTGVLTGTTLTYRYPGLDLEGADEHIVITDHADFSPGDGTTGTSLTISAWVNMDDTASFKIASKGVYNTNGEWDFYTDASETIYIQFYDESVDNCRIGRNYNIALTSYVGSWVHLVATYNGGKISTGCKIYLNGTQVDNATEEQNQATFVAVENLNGDVHIGRSDGVYANGQFNDVMIFNIEKSAAEVKSIYEVTRRRYSA